MKARIRLLLAAFVACTLVVQANTPPTVTDPLDAKIYTLKNGLTVMISVNRSEPRLQTMIAVRAGSKNDPSDNTGLAHYLEHLLFKGTDRFGTKDFAKEKVYLDQIESLYEEYNRTTDAAKRKAIYRRIDSVSGLASQHSIANEYDKLLASIGATGTNAFTSMEQTVYINDIPANQLDKWLQIEAERFRNPVLRGFHTELEAVYEEKNIGMDNDGRKMSEATLAGLFTRHPYGTQTTIGTVEHLKNPSIRKIREYFAKYYVPNNMAIIISGDIDPARALEQIEKTFGAMKPGTVPAFTFTPEPARSAPTEITVNGQEAEHMQIAYRMPGAGTKESRVLEVADLLLAYKTAGFIDLNLRKAQKVQDAGSSPWILKDYSIHFLTGKPKEGQTLEEVRDLLLSQIDLVKKGAFDEATLKAVVRNLKVDQMRQYESNSGRCFAMLNAFTTGQSWEEAAHHLDLLAQVTKQEVVDFANKYYGNDYVVVYKRKGTDTQVAKVEKPEITPITVNREDVSPFVKTMLETPASTVSPLFVDYAKDIQRVSIKSNLPMLYVRNSENELYSLYYVFDMGKNNDRKLPFAVNYLQYLGTDKYSADQLAKEFFKLGAEFGVSTANDQVYVSLSGLGESFEDAVRLFEEMLANVKPDDAALQQLIARELKSRADMKLNKRAILNEALRSYAVFGKHNPFTDRLSESELKALTSSELVATLRGLTQYAHKVMYYGPQPAEAVSGVVAKYHAVPATFKPYPPATQYARNETNENVIYFVDYDMVQAELMWLNKQGTFDATRMPTISLFNEYFGGGMSSVVFQTIRESKALAYSTFGAYASPAKKEDPHYVIAYVGTQADKLGEAIPAMNELLTTLPRTEQSFATAKEALRKQLETERITRSGILFDYLAAQKRGVDHDLRQDTYASLDKIGLDDVVRFHSDNVTGRKYAMCVLGSKNKINMEELKKYGRVVELTLTDVFGY
ncbi:MAG TPA: insulinase family protein [Candidatus Kapabacteria bacterium]|nr:insulinase family protein [Candidatus Kapabacteria bacterium]